VWKRSRWQVTHAVPEYIRKNVHMEYFTSKQFNEGSYNKFPDCPYYTLLLISHNCWCYFQCFLPKWSSFIRAKRIVLGVSCNFFQVRSFKSQSVHYYLPNPSIPLWGNKRRLSKSSFLLLSLQFICVFLILTNCDRDWRFEK